MKKTDGKINLYVFVEKTGDGKYLVNKSVYNAKTGEVIQLPILVKYGMTYKEAHALKRQIINDYFG